MAPPEFPPPLPPPPVNVGVRGREEKAAGEKTKLEALLRWLLLAGGRGNEMKEKVRFELSVKLGIRFT